MASRARAFKRKLFEAKTLDAPALAAIQGPVSRPDGRRRKTEESPGSTEKRRRITSGGGDPRESATESKPPSLAEGKGERVR